MLNIREYLKDNILITDGAMGTYYKQIADNPLKVSELENIKNKQIIEDIHNQYIKAGSNLIRTNTFSANKAILQDDEVVESVIINGYNIAKEAADKNNVYVGAVIGTIPDYYDYEKIVDEYKKNIDLFIDLGAEIFVFETLNSIDYIGQLVQYLKQKKSDSFVITNFSLTDTGVTKTAVSYERIINEMSKNSNVDAFGFNCGVGPMHMYNLLSKVQINLCNKYMIAMPNAGYPEIINNKIKYVLNPEYFAQTVTDMAKLGLKIVGGCCGTTPLHIEILSKKLNQEHLITKKSSNIFLKKDESENKIKKNYFHKKLDSNDFIIAVELDPPFKADASKIVKGAEVLKENGVDIITIADSPMGKSRADSIIISSKIKRETGIETLPHICCRDKNSISLRSCLIGAYIENIRNVLVVTGDPIPGELKEDTKSVFNLNSYTLINMINEMNKDIFLNENIRIGAAANFNVKNKSLEYKRLIKKRKLGAEFFLTQPIFTKDTIEFIKNINKDRDFKILGGIMPIVSYRNVQFINNELAGIAIPDIYVNRFLPELSREDAEKIGIETAVEIAESIKDYVDGFYIIAPFNRYEMVVKIINKLGIN